MWSFMLVWPNLKGDTIHRCRYCSVDVAERLGTDVLVVLLPE